MLLKITQRNYLRARGEYDWLPNVVVENPELPPRTRRIQVVFAGGGGFLGTTSAHAENTRVAGLLCTFNRNYLRARGEYRIRHTP